MTQRQNQKFPEKVEKCRKYHKTKINKKSIANANIKHTINSSYHSVSMTLGSLCNIIAPNPCHNLMGCRVQCQVWCRKIIGFVAVKSIQRFVASFKMFVFRQILCVIAVWVFLCLSFPFFVGGFRGMMAVYLALFCAK